MKYSEMCFALNVFFGYGLIIKYLFLRFCSLIKFFYFIFKSLRYYFFFLLYIKCIEYRIIVTIMDILFGYYFFKIIII